MLDYHELNENIHTHTADANAYTLMLRECQQKGSNVSIPLSAEGLLAIACTQVTVVIPDSALQGRRCCLTLC